jgi:membrane dipeptidase
VGGVYTEMDECSTEHTSVKMSRGRNEGANSTACLRTESLTASSPKSPDLHFRSLVIDTHVDTTQRLLFDGFNLGQRHPDGSIDIPRLRDGGVGAIFFAIWVPGRVTGEAAVKSAFAQIEAIRREVLAQSADLQLARNASDILAAHRKGKIAIVAAVEGGHMINSDLDVLREFSALGVKYMTLTHNANVEWADSSKDTPRHNGLTEFGKDVIREMNQLGMMVDVSHVSDQTFRDVLETSQAPVMASHSNCRALCGSPRNLTDEMMQMLATKRGLVQINFHVGFLSNRFRDAMNAHPEYDKGINEALIERCGENSACQLLEAARMVRELVSEGKLPRVEWTEILDHIDHAVKLIGADHVGIGSDFDGADMPYGMEDASCLPKITEALLARGYSESDIQKILGGNALRLMQDVESVAVEEPE